MTPKNGHEPIAIIGMSCRFPGVSDPEALWTLVERQQEGVVEYPGGRTPELDAFYARAGLPDGPVSTRGGFLPDVDRFDAGFFEISPREAEWMDPQQRLLLESAWEALEDAGIPAGAVERAGVFVGAWMNEYERHATEHAPVVEFFNMTGGPLYGTSSRVAFQFNMRGPDASVNAACASALVAVHLAVRSLRSGECSLALAGGVNVLARPEMTQALSRSGMLSPEGRCKFGDASADGFVRSEGVGMLVLKRLADAERDGDRVLALIRGTAVTNSGRSSGLLATPSVEGQERAMREALEDAGVDPASVDFVEAHGTGTRAGDPVEMAALSAVFGRVAGRGAPCRTASVKSNLGHTESAAGIASIIRTVEAMRHRRFPASLHARELNPTIDWDAGVVLEREGCVWISDEGRPRRAGINGLGLTGTNAHVVLEEAPRLEPAAQETEKAAAFLLPVSASSAAALRRRAGDFAQALENVERGEVSLEDFVSTAARRRTHLAHRLAVVGSEAGEFRKQLAAFAAGEEPALVASGIAEAPRKIAFVFPGQGSQWLGMGRELLRTSVAFRRALEELDPLISEEAGWSVLQQLADSSLEERLSRIDVVQPTLFAMEVALAAWWESCGVRPDAVVGHSMGEVAAAYVAGILPARDAVRVICRRSALLLRVAGQGAMAVVDLTREEAERAIAGVQGLSIAVCNSRRSTVLAGDPEALDRVVNELEHRDVFCRRVKVDVASHSPQMDALREDLLEQLAGVRGRAGAVPLYSTVRASLWDGARMDEWYWADNLRSPVLFADAVEELIGQGFNTFVEMSPHPLLVPFVEQTAGEAGRAVVAVGSLRREEPEAATALLSLGRVFAAGAEVDWTSLSPAGQVVSLPKYPWQRERFWMEGAARARRGGGHPLLGEPVETAAGERVWLGAVSVESHPWLRDHQVGGTVLVPASAYAEMAIAAGRTLFGSAAVVDEMTLTEALAVPAGTGAEMQAIAAPETASSFTMKFFGRAPGGGNWQPTGECRVRHGSGETMVSAGVGIWEDAELAERVISGGEHARRMAARGYDFGPAFCCVDWMLLEQRTALGQIRAEQRRGSYWMHPATLDGALQVLAHLLIEAHGTQQLLLPVGFERLEVHSGEAPAEGAPLLVRASAGEPGMRGTVTVFDRMGRGLLTVHGVELRPLEREASVEDALYSLEWQKLSPATGAAAVGPWLVIGGNGVGGELSAALERRGAAVVRCSTEAILKGTVAAAGGGAVWLGPLDLHAGTELAIAEKVLAEGAALIAALAEQGVTRIWAVTRGTQTAAGERVENVPAAGAWGMFAAIAHEVPSVPMGCVDLPVVALEGESEALASVLLESREESRIALRGDGIYGARLTPWSAGEGERVGSGDLRSDEGFEVEQRVRGSLASLGLRTVPADAPAGDEVEIAVEAAGLNFLDALRAMGINEALASAHFGGECAGTVVRVGSAVSRFRPGDAVLAISPSFQNTGLLASRVRVPDALVARKPEGMSFAEAAGIPCVFLTAWYGLVKLARLEKGEKVLIHAAAGGVGLAAIQIARWIGAEVWATAGSEEKRAYLRGLGIAHVMDSRTLDFSREIRDLTGGRGVDVVLNSLAGPAIAAGLEALAPYGRFVEIGKRDLWENSRLGMRPFLRNLSYFAIDLADAVEARRPMVSGLLQEVMERFAAGELSPAPTTVFPVSAVGDAFQHLARAAHIGKVVLGMNAGEVEVRRSADRLHGDASYLITGGLGGVGLQIAGAMVRQGARHLVLTSRRTPSGAALEEIARLEEQGAEVQVRLADVGDANAVRELVGGMAAGARPLRGIVHAAGVLDDGVAANLTVEKFRRVMAGKVAGALAIDAIVKPGQLDFLVYASSAAGVLGNAGQGNYAAANAMLDALAHQQRARKIPAVSIDWGTWSEVGLAAAAENRGARMETHGLLPLSPELGRALFVKVLDELPPQVAAMRLDADRWCETSAASARSGLLERLRRSGRDGAGVSGDGRDEFASVHGDELRSRLIVWLRQQVAAVLRLEVERVPEDKAVRSLGLDSLMALELRNRLERHLHMKLSATLVWNYPTVVKLAEFLQKRLEEGRQTNQKEESRAPRTEEKVAEECVPANGELSASELLEAELLEAETLLNVETGAR